MSSVPATVSLYVPDGTTMVPMELSRACWTAARRLHLLLAVAQMPSAVLASAASAVVLTWNVGAAAAGLDAATTSNGDRTSPTVHTTKTDTGTRLMNRCIGNPPSAEWLLKRTLARPSRGVNAGDPRLD